MNRIGLDIETLPRQDKTWEDYLERVKPPSNYKKEETIQNWMKENAEDIATKLWAETGLDGTFGEICSIAWLNLDDENRMNVVTRDDAGNTEKECIEIFFDYVRDAMKAKGRGDYQKVQFIGHSILDFDLPFLRKRAIVHNIPIPYALQKAMNQRYSGTDVYDTMKEWAGWRGYIKQDELCEALGIELPKVAIGDGSQVLKAFQDGRYQDIGAYNVSDVAKLIAIYKRMNFLDG